MDAIPLGFSVELMDLWTAITEGGDCHPSDEWVQMTGVPGLTLLVRPLDDELSIVFETRIQITGRIKDTTSKMYIASSTGWVEIQDISETDDRIEMELSDITSYTLRINEEVSA